MKKIAFYTLGCRANQYQTEILKSKFSNIEYQLSNFSSLADTYVINTCTVTHDAERKSRQAIRRALRQNPKAKVYVAGCLVKLAKEDLQAIFPNIEFISLDPIAHNPQSLTPRVRSNLMIQDGCENFCSYCVVPYARGKIKSKPVKAVVAEAQALAKVGAREIILTGINLGAYEYGLANVLDKLSKVQGLLRLRLSSIEPMYLTKDLIDAIAQSPKVCDFLHIPLQSGDNKILKAMNRNYTREDFQALVEYIRGKMPSCGLSTDIIVGFPGEGPAEFQNTVDLINQLKFSRLHIFSYSKRPGTAAATLLPQVSEATKQARNKILSKLRQKYMRQFARQYFGQPVEILVEQKGEGLTSNFIRCFFNDPADSSGSLKKIFAKSVSNSGELRA